MAKLTVRGIEERPDINPTVSLLNTLMRAGLHINHRCGGKALCGTCRVRILDGERYLNPMSEIERNRLSAVNAPVDFRLACQTYAFGDVTIEIPDS